MPPLHTSSWENLCVSIKIVQNFVHRGPVDNKSPLVKWTVLTHWGRVTHMCISKLTIIGLDNGLSPGQAIIRTNAGILLIALMRTNFGEILVEIYTFSFEKKHLEMLSGKWWPFVSKCYYLSQRWPNTLTHVWPCINVLMTFSDAFLYMKNYEFWQIFDWSLFLRVQLTIAQHLFR